MLNNLMTLLRLEKIRKILSKINGRYFSKMKAILKLGLQYEPENLDVNKVCFAK